MQLATHDGLEQFLTTWSSSGPRYAQLADGLRAAIERGILLPDSKLPAERTLATRLGMSRGTVVAAYDLLRGEHILGRRQGSGTWVIGLPFPPTSPGTKRAEQHHDEPAVSFTLANLEALPPVYDAVRAVAADGLAPLETHGYSMLGLPALRAEIASHYARQGLPTTPDEILVTTGAQEALYLIARELGGAGHPIAMEDPSYSGAIDAFRQTGAAIVPVATGRDGVEVEALSAACSTAAPQLAYLMPVHNPTGAAMSDATRRGVLAVAERFGTTIVEDRTLAHLRFHGAPSEPIASALPERQGIIVESISKVFWGGLRIGWIRAAQSTIATLARRKSLVNLATPALSQLVAARLVPTIAETQPLVRARIAERYERLVQLMREQLPEWSWTAPAGGLSLWTKLPFGEASELVRIAGRHGVELVPGNAMSSSGTLASHLRIPYVLDSPRMTDGVGRLAAAWHEYEAIAHRRSTHSLVV